MTFHIYWEVHNPNWQTHIFQRGRYTTNQICIILTKKHVNTWDTWPLFDCQIAKITDNGYPGKSAATHPRSGAASFSQALADSNPVVAAPAAVGVSVATPGEEQDLADTATRRPAMGVQMKGDAKGSGLEEFSMNLTPIFRDQQAFHCLYVKA